MIEQEISLETATLAKSKGFKELCLCYYSDGTLQEPYLENGSSTDTDFRVDLSDLLEQHNNIYHFTYSAPTQSHLQTWLREEHNMHIWIVPISLNNYKRCYQNGPSYAWSNNGFKTYEEALEDGLIQCLNLVNK